MIIVTQNRERFEIWGESILRHICGLLPSNGVMNVVLPVSVDSC